MEQNEISTFLELKKDAMAHFNNVKDLMESWSQKINDNKHLLTSEQVQTLFMIGMSGTEDEQEFFEQCKSGLGNLRKGL